MKKDIGALILLIPCVVTDLKYRQIPVVFVSVFMLIGACIRFSAENTAVMQLLSGALPGVFLILIALATHGKAGMGDGIMAAALGVWYGLYTVTGMLITALSAAAVYGLLKLAVKKDRADKELPFAPFLCAGCLAVRIAYYLQGGIG